MPFRIGQPGTEQHEGAIPGIPQVIGLQSERQPFVEECFADAGVYAPIGTLQHGAEVAFALVVGIKGENPLVRKLETVLQKEVNAAAVHILATALIGDFEERLGEVDAELRFPDADGG